MKKMCMLGLLIVALAGTTMSQLVYEYDGPFPDTNFVMLGINVVNGGIGVDPEGKVWIQPYTTSTKDSIQVNDTTWTRLRPIYCYLPDGKTPAPFSPIKVLTGPDETGTTKIDTMFGYLGYGGCINPSNGNFMAVWYGKIWEIDYKTGQGVRTRNGNITGLDLNSPASVAVNSLGEVYMTRVVGAAPGVILNPDFSLGPQFSPSVGAIGRTITVSLDGNDVWVPRFTAVPPTTFLYHSDAGTLGSYALTDSIVGPSVESIAIHPVTGYVWFSADYRSVAATYPYTYTHSPNTYYAYNPVAKTIVDSFAVAHWPVSPATGAALPRGIAFSPTGDTVYVGKFDGANLPFAVSRFVRRLASVEPIDGNVPSGYALAQNFPNPFNPTTEISFQIAKQGFVTLRVYDVLGREVASLVNQELVAGSYRIPFNASNLTTGTYLYELRAGDVRLVKKMALVK